MHDDLAVIGGGRERCTALRRIALRGGICVSTRAPAEIPLDDRDERIGLLRPPAVRRMLRARYELDADCRVPGGDGVLERAPDELAVGFRELDRDSHHAARPIPKERERAPLPSAFRRVHAVGLDVSNLPAALLDLAGGSLERVREQQILVVQRRDARERAHLRVRQTPVRKRRRDRGQRAKGLRSAHLLSRRRQRQPAPPREPLGAARKAPLREPEPIVEVAHEPQHPVRLGVHLPHEPADFQIEIVDGAVGERSDACRAASELGGHRRPPRRRIELLILYTASRAFASVFSLLRAVFRRPSSANKAHLAHRPSAVQAADFPRIAPTAVQGLRAPNLASISDRSSGLI